MKRLVQGLCIALGSIVGTIVVIAAAVAWGPHHCDLVFPKIIGCAIGNYESLSAGMVAAGAAIFAGWLAWSAVQFQIAAEERRAAADRVEVEQVLQGDLDHFAEGLGAVWKILERFDPNEGGENNRNKLEGITYGIEHLTKDTWLSSSRQMVTMLGWRRRRDYERLFADLERFRQTLKSTVDHYEILDVVGAVGTDLEILRPDTRQWFEGRHRRSFKAWTFGYHIEYRAGVAKGGGTFDPAD
jgi:PPE-repeat protein